MNERKLGGPYVPILLQCCMSRGCLQPAACCINILKQTVRWISISKMASNVAVILAFTILSASWAMSSLPFFCNHPLLSNEVTDSSIDKKYRRRSRDLDFEQDCRVIHSLSPPLDFDDVGELSFYFINVNTGRLRGWESEYTTRLPSFEDEESDRAWGILFFRVQVFWYIVCNYPEDEINLIAKFSEKKSWS